MITWVDGLIPDPSPASDVQVRAAEDELRVDLPPDFLAIARTHQGAQPLPGGVSLPNGFVTGVEGLLHFADSPFTGNITAAWWARRDGLDRGVIPFALDVGHDVFCFDYRTDHDEPPVVFWSVDFGPLPLAPTFTAFLALLHE